MNFFTLAKPIFIKGKSLEMNYQAGFVCKFSAESGKSYTLRLAGSTLYRVSLNGSFVHYGPARPPHGYLRVDELKLACKPGDNLLSIEIAGYNCPSFYTLDIPSFVQAEICADGECVAYTGRDFKGISLTSLRERIVPRYSYQRAFTEVWYLDSPAADWTSGDFIGEELEEPELGREYLERGFALPEYKLTAPAVFSRAGRYTLNENSGQRSLTRYFIPSDEVKCFEYSDCPNDILSATDAKFSADPNIDGKSLRAGEFAEYSFGHIGTGFIRTKIKVSEPSVVYVVFAEKRRGDDIFYADMPEVLNIIKYRLPAGAYQLESFECYSFMYAGILVESGKIEDCQFTLREYCYPVKPLAVKTGDDTLDRVMLAAYESFRQNTIDCYMDCPGRERGGWLCDSFFTGKASLLFTGSTECERSFLDNFRLAHFPGLPSGLLPECYPGDNLWKGSIPQWTMWYVMELGEFGERGGDTAPFNELLEKILAFFAGYENSDGLLERLPYWNFVEWTKANQWVQDVNYPTNMLYCGVLRVSARLLSKPGLAEKADRIAAKIVAQSYDGEYFRDHAVRKADGSLEICPDRSAICQHEAIMFDIIDPDAPEYAKLIHSVTNAMGFGQDASSLPAELEPLDLFIGYAVRVVVLLKLGLWQQNLDEIKALYGSMAEKTGTLWEHRAGSASLNHGFGSFTADAIVRCLRELRK